MYKHLLAALSVAVSAFLAGGAAALPLERLKLPDGFRIELYAEVPAARSMVVMGDWNAVLVGSRGPFVHAAVDDDGDGRIDRTVRVLDGLKLANGIAWKDSWFYVAEQHRLVRYRAPDLKTLMSAKPEVLYDRLIDNSWHGWRYARFGPDGRLYVAIGSPCNICPIDGIAGTIVSFAPEGGAPKIFARGVRNSVGFDFQPGTGHLWFTDNGADNMGNDSPPDELNRATQPSQWFGFPYFGGGRDRTPDFKGRPLPETAQFPEVAFGAHVAALGISFYRGDAFPAAYRGDAFVAQHGSWNRTVPDGYRVARVRIDKKTGRAEGWEPFVSGWLGADGEAWGRPVDVKELPDGALLISDDRAGVLYRVTATK